MVSPWMLTSLLNCTVIDFGSLAPIPPKCLQQTINTSWRKKGREGRWQGRKEKGVRKTRQGPNTEEECWHFKSGRVTLKKEK